MQNEYESQMALCHYQTQISSRHNSSGFGEVELQHIRKLKSTEWVMLIFWIMWLLVQTHCAWLDDAVIVVSYVCDYSWLMRLSIRGKTRYSTQYSFGLAIAYGSNLLFPIHTGIRGSLLCLFIFCYLSSALEFPYNDIPIGTVLHIWRQAGEKRPDWGSLQRSWTQE